ncbi:MAG: MFS transporter [Bacteroidetes bacterium]|nr:MFS transporter [Bacteroidota bacterium]
MKSYRWRIVMILFLATTINYIDRNVLSFTMIDEGFRKTMLGLPDGATLTDADINTFKERMGFVDAAFKTAYAIGFLLVGWFIDKVGTRRGFSWSIIVWSLAGVFNAFVNSVRGLSLTRFMLGIGEAGNFPSAVKSVAEWFPKKERAFATGIFNAGANVGIICTAFAVPAITLYFGWRVSFILTGLLGFVVLLLWRFIYKKPEEHSTISREELAHIKSDGDERDDSAQKISYARLLTFRQTWAIVVCKFLADPIWYFYLTWLPDFFNSNEALDQKLDLKNISLPFLVIYLVSDIGSIFFGWLSSKFITMGWSVAKARKTTMLICALCVTSIFLASTTHSIFVAVALVALATAAHQGWSANVYTMSSDMFPKNAVSSVMGIGGMFGAVSGIALAASAGIIRVKFGYLPLFVLASSSYLIAWLIMTRLVPDWKRVTD